MLNLKKLLTQIINKLNTLTNKLNTLTDKLNTLTDKLNTLTNKLNTLTTFKTLSISRVISTTYMSATDFARLHAYQKNGMLYLNFNALFNGSNYTVSDTTTIATISNWNAIDNAIISVPCQNDGTKVMTITVTTDGAIRVYSTKAIYGWYRTFICVPSRS